jgi:hypothetical protein
MNIQPLKTSSKQPNCDPPIPNNNQTPTTKNTTTLAKSIFIKITGSYLQDDPSKFCGTGILKFSDGGVYTGDFFDGKMHGKGILNQNNLKYVGDFFKGERHGNGVLRTGTRIIYDGEFAKGHPNGKGTYRNLDGTVYEGEVRNGEYHGQGTLVGCNGSRYEGEWKNGLQDGFGTIIYIDGNTYTGQWLLGKYEGGGRHTHRNGCVYDGKWKAGKQQGHGIQTNKDGAKYDGDWFEGLQQGHGSCTFPDGSTYVGEWKEGVIHGCGKLTNCNGNIYDGEWVKGEQSGFGKLTSKNGAFYEGQWKNSKENGRGHCVYANGCVYVGEWKDGIEHGKGCGTTVSGARYTGDFFEGEFHGHGKFKFPNGLVFEGEFSHGIPAILETYYQNYAAYLRPQLNSKNRDVKLVARRETLHIEMCQKAIAARKESFEANRLSIPTAMESKLSQQKVAELQQEKEKQRQKIIDELVADENHNKEAQKKQSPPSSRKSPSKSPSPQKKSSCQSESSSSSSSSAVTALPSVSIMDPIKNNPAERFKVHPRVKRWHISDLMSIREFADFSNGAKVKLYEGLDDDEIKIQRMYHHLPNIEKILGAGNENKYFSRTDRGYRLLASLVRSDNNIEYGDIFIGVDSNTKIIFHKKFSHWPGTPKDYERLFTSPTLTTMAEDFEEGMWETVGDTTWMMLSDGIVEFNFSGESHKLRVYPLYR